MLRRLIICKSELSSWLLGITARCYLPHGYSLFLFSLKGLKQCSELQTEDLGHNSDSVFFPPCGNTKLSYDMSCIITITLCVCMMS